MTEDIDFLIDPELKNEAAVFEALRTLPDKAVNELDAGDVGRFTVVRIADEVLVDVMANACGVDYGAAIKDVVYSEIDGVRVPFASPATLWKMKQTHRAKDIPDLIFLNKILTGSEELNETDAKGFWKNFWESLKDSKG